MKLRVKCVAAMLQPSPKKEDEVTMFRFQPVDAPTGKPDTFWYENGLVIYSREHGNFQTGSEYELELSA